MAERVGERGFSRRGLLRGASAVAATSVLGACSTGEPLGGPPSVKGPIPEGRKLSGRVVVATASGPPRAARQALIAAYRRRRPEVEVVFGAETFHDADAYDSWLEGALAGPSDQRPDIVSGERVPGFGGYVDFDEYRARVNPHTGRPWADGYDFGVARSVNARGERTAIGTECVGAYWFYNKTLLGRAEVEPPTTWEELVSACAKLTTLGVVPLSTSYADVVSRWFPVIYFDQYHVDWVEEVRAQPGDWCFDPKLDGKFVLDPGAGDLHASYTFSRQRFFRALRDRRLRFDTPQMVAIIDNLVKVFPRHAGADFATRSDPYTPFLQQHSAIMVDSSRAMPILRADLEGLSPTRVTELAVAASSVESFDWDVIPFPSMTGPLVLSGTRTIEEATGFLGVIDKSPEQTELAMDFLMFWLSGAGYPAFLEGATKAGDFLAQGPLLVKGVRYPDHIQSLFDREIVRPAGITRPVYGDFWVHGTGGSSQRALTAHLSRALRGELTPQDYATRLQGYVQQNLPALVRTAGLTSADLDTPARRPASLA